MEKGKTKPVDLFKIIVDESQLHPNFQQTIAPKNKPIRKLLEQWVDGFVDRDGKLTIEFQKTYNSVFWELYLFNLFRYWGFSNDFGYHAPDFNIKEYGGICVEATIASNAANTNPEWIDSGKQIEISNMMTSEDREEFVKQSTIRLANAFSYKLKKFRQEYSKLEHVKSKPFILAIAPFDRPWFYLQTSQAISLLLYAKRIKEDGNGGWKLVDQYYVEKDNGAEIDLGLFNNDSCSEISAVIFSNVATFGKAQALAIKEQQFPVLFYWLRYNEKTFGIPNIGISWGRDYDESIDDGIGIYLNPFASHPVPREFIKKFQTIHWDALKIESAHNSLLSRMTHTINFHEDENTAQETLGKLNSIITKL